VSSILNFKKKLLLELSESEGKEAIRLATSDWGARTALTIPRTTKRVPHRAVANITLKRPTGLRTSDERR
jgi:hypothetical protein